MELEPIDGGAAPALSQAPADDPLPTWAARIMSQIAHAIDDTITARGWGIGVRDFAARFVGVPATELVVCGRHFAPLEFQLISLVLADDIARHGTAGVIGEDMTEPPQWAHIDLGHDTVRVPDVLAAALRAGSVAPAPLVIEVAARWPGPQRVVNVYARANDAAHADRYLESLVGRAHAGDNPFRGRCLEARTTGAGLAFAVVPTPTDRRTDIVLPEGRWHEIDRNVHGLFRALPHLRAAGLSVNRGVLLAGPPGTGKTAVCRALAAELAGDATVVFCDARTVEESVRELYEQLATMGPSLVVMEDVDLVVGHRGQGGGRALLDFLVSLDGATSSHEGVVTIATTNDPGAIDPAAKRASRFDVLIEVPPPDVRGRREILARYLRDVPDHRIDIGVAARETPGLTGAELRELVSELVLRHAGDQSVEGGTPLDTAAFVRVAREHRREPPPGQYL